MNGIIIHRYVFSYDEHYFYLCFRSLIVTNNHKWYMNDAVFAWWRHFCPQIHMHRKILRYQSRNTIFHIDHLKICGLHNTEWYLNDMGYNREDFWIKLKCLGENSQISHWRHFCPNFYLFVAFTGELKSKFRLQFLNIQQSGLKQISKHIWPQWFLAL